MLQPVTLISSAQLSVLDMAPSPSTCYQLVFVLSGCQPVASASIPTTPTLTLQYWQWTRFFIEFLVHPMTMESTKSRDIQPRHPTGGDIASQRATHVLSTGPRMREQDETAGIEATIWFHPLSCLFASLQSLQATIVTSTPTSIPASVAPAQK